MKEPTDNAPTHWKTIDWLLRGTVALQCVGQWRWLVQVGESPLLHWLLDPADVGGLEWSESAALTVQQSIGWVVLVLGLLALWRPRPLLVWPLLVVQLFLVAAMWRVAEGYPLEVTWLPPWLVMLFPLATQLGRLVAPFGLLLFDRSSNRPACRATQVIEVLRWATAIVFLAHGIEAWLLNPKFVDLLLLSANQLLGADLTQESAESLLKLIGVADILAAFGCMFSRWRPLLWWMAAWGLITASSRLVAYPWQMALHETLTRVAHFGLPLAVALWPQLIKWEATEEPTPPETSSKNSR